MRKLLGGTAFAALVIGAFFAVGPREPVNLTPRFDAASLPADLDAFLATREAGIAPDVAERIVWAGAPGAQTDVAVVYLHGFSATSEEIRPVPDRVARALGGNLVFVRLSGHGQGPEAMAGPTVQDWVDDTARALAIGHRIGRKVLVIATSTGSTLAAEAARSNLGAQMDALVMISPNFAIQNPAAPILTWPLARYWGPLVAGREHCFDPMNAAQAKYWTNCYPTTAIFPMAALAAHARGGDYGAAKMPMLLITDAQDQVVSPQASAEVAARWGGPVTAHPVSLIAGDDPWHHVLAGDIVSPSQTAPVSAAILDWARANL